MYRCCVERPDPPTVVSLTDSSVKLTYRPPAHLSQVSKFLVTCRTVLDFLEWKHETTESLHKFTGMSANTFYEFTVATVINGEVGPPSEPLLIKTKITFRK